MGGARATPLSSAGLVRRVPSRSSATRRAAMVNARQSKIDDVTIEMHNLIVGQNDVDLLSFDLDAGG